MRYSCCATSVVVLAGFALIPVRGDENSTTKPPYERLLQGNDATQAAVLRKRIEDRTAADDYAGAIQAGEELLALRQRVQGADHYQVANIKHELTALRKVAVLSAEQRVGWRRVVQGGVEAERLEQRARYAEALPMLKRLLQERRRVLGEEHPDTARSQNNVAYNHGTQLPQLGLLPGDAGQASPG